MRDSAFLLFAGLGFFSQKTSQDYVHYDECIALVNMAEEQIFETDAHFRIISGTQRTIFSFIEFNCQV